MAEQKDQTSTIWGGRFSAAPAAVMQAINASIGIDKALWRQDIAGSRAHAAMLAQCGIISSTDAEAISHGLDSIEKDITEGRFVFSEELEDIHMNVEEERIESWCEETMQKCVQYAKDAGRNWEVVSHHLEKVKWYAPRIRHVVLDVSFSSMSSAS